MKGRTNVVQATAGFRLSLISDPAGPPVYSHPPARRTKRAARKRESLITESNLKYNVSGMGGAVYPGGLGPG